MLMRSCILQQVSNMKRRAFSRNSSFNGTTVQLLSSTRLPKNGSFSITCTVQYPRFSKNHFFMISKNKHSNLNILKKITPYIYIEHKERKASYILTLFHLLLSPLKVKIDVNTCQKLCNWIGKRVLLLLNDFNELFKLRPSLLVDDECSCKVAQKMRSICLNGI